MICTSVLNGGVNFLTYIFFSLFDTREKMCDIIACKYMRRENEESLRRKKYG